MKVNKRDLSKLNRRMDNHQEDCSAELAMIMSIYNIEPKEYRCEPAFEDWCDHFEEDKTKKIGKMNVDMENIPVFEAEVDTKIEEQVNLARNQYHNHVMVIRRIMRRIEGKVVRFKAQRKALEADLKEINNRLAVLNAMKSKMENLGEKSPRFELVED